MGERSTPSSQTGDDDVAAATVLRPGKLLSRYAVLERVGAGGMGVVYAAYDPQLDRRVAVKLLSDESLVDTLGRHRMLAEAQALARLTHPNVVAVHDVGMHEGRTFIAMEFVQGKTLKAWLAAERPGWRDVVRVCASAGRGLAAAHAAYAGFGNTLRALGQYHEARDAHQRAYDIALARFGSEHPALATHMANLAGDLERLGKNDEARDLLVRALALREASLGPNARATGESLLNLSAFEYKRLELDAAREHAERAVEILERVLGPDHPYVGGLHHNLGLIAQGQKRIDDALRHFEELERVFAKSYGPTHPNMVIPVSARAGLLRDRRDYATALPLYERALELGIAALGQEHPTLAYDYVGKAVSLFNLGRVDEAVAPAERALALREHVTAEPNELSFSYFLLANILWTAPSSDAAARSRALELGRKALKTWREGGADDPKRAAQYEAWVREREGDAAAHKG